MSLNKEVMLCVHSILLPSTVQPSASTEFSRRSINLSAWTDRYRVTRGIAARTFERSFQLADYVQVKGASLENGLLHVDLVREIPEAMKPRAIRIASPSKVLNVEPTKVAA
jgi:Hsp20/alpha crystallin family